MIQKLGPQKLEPRERLPSRAANSGGDRERAQVAWNELWQSSSDAMPTVLHPNVQEIAQDFLGLEPKMFFHDQRGTLDIGLPLVQGRLWKFFSSLNLPNCPWIQAGGLLADKDRVTTRSFKNLAKQLIESPEWFLCLDWAQDTEEIRRLSDALKQAGCLVWKQPQFDVGFVRIAGEWPEYFESLSKSFRKKIRKQLRLLSETGDVSFERVNQFSDREQVESVIETALAIEHLGWKGESGGSINSNPEIKRCFVRAMQRVADQGMLEMQFLNVDSIPVAFEIGYLSNGTYYSFKVGFDPQFSRFSPGQLLMYFQLRSWFENGEVDLVNTVGELNEATAKWINEQRTLYRFVVATGGWRSRMVLRTVRRARKLLRR